MAVGGELSQGGHPMACYRKKLTPTEDRYCVTDCKLTAIYLVCMKWRHYLHGNVCNIYTDHEPLIYNFVQPHLNGHQACGLERLAKLNLKVHCAPSVDNIPAVL